MKPVRSAKGLLYVDIIFKYMYVGLSSVCLATPAATEVISELCMSCDVLRCVSCIIKTNEWRLGCD